MDQDRVIEVDSIVGDDDTDTRLLREMANSAESYIRSFSWCLKVIEGYLADGVGGVIAIFLFKTDIAKIGDDKWIWVFVGDIPSAYLEMDSNYRNPHDALDRYIKGIDEWVAAEKTGRSLDDLIPIDVSKDPESLEALAVRASTLRQQVLPHIRKSNFHPGLSTSTFET